MTNGATLISAEEKQCRLVFLLEVLDRLYRDVLSREFRRPVRLLCKRVESSSAVVDNSRLKSFDNDRPAKDYRLALDRC